MSVYIKSLNGTVMRNNLCHLQFLCQQLWIIFRSWWNMNETFFLFSYQKNYLKHFFDYLLTWSTDLSILTIFFLVVGLFHILKEVEETNTPYYTEQRLLWDRSQKFSETCLKKYFVPFYMSVHLLLNRSSVFFY